ncbi:MAG: hypothetical protein J7K87_02095 [Candidatus Aenigmarchaeota archaeon]|nr:hypothetical protein [Candidatus Aenigmarchaeota archaeon]
MGRGKPKEHGDPKDRYFLGKPEGNVVVMEDVTTTGSSTLREIAKLSKIDANITAVISLTNRNELTPIPGKDDEEVVEKFRKIYESAVGEKYEGPMSVEEAIFHMGIPYYALSEARTLLPAMFKKKEIPEPIIRSIEEEFKEYGAIKIKLR